MIDINKVDQGQPQTHMRKSESNIDESVPTLRKSVILTHSLASEMKFEKEKRNGAIQISVNTLNQKGSEYLRRILDELIDTHEKNFLIVQFEKPADLIHFKYIRQYLDDYTHRLEKESIKKLLRTKFIVLVVHKRISILKTEKQKSSKKKNKKKKKRQVLDSGITFGFEESDWEYLVIENLVNSSYRLVLFWV